VPLALQGEIGSDRELLAKIADEPNDVRPPPVRHTGGIGMEPTYVSLRGLSRNPNTEHRQTT